MPLTQEQMEEILSYQNGRFIDLPLDASTTIPNAVEALKNFHLSPVNQSIGWDYGKYASFDSFLASSEIPSTPKVLNFTDIQYKAIIWKYWTQIVAIMEILNEIEATDRVALVAEYKAANNIE